MGVDGGLVCGGGGAVSGLGGGGCVWGWVGLIKAENGSLMAAVAFGGQPAVAGHLPKALRSAATASGGRPAVAGQLPEAEGACMSLCLAGAKRKPLLSFDG